MRRNHCVWFPQSLFNKGWGAWVGGSGDSARILAGLERERERDREGRGWVVFCFGFGESGVEMGSWWSWVNGLGYVVGAIVCASLALLLTFQEKLVYVPVIPGLKRGYSITPSRLRLRYEDVWLVAKDGVRLHSWFIPASPGCQGPTVMFFQENAGNIAHRLQFVELMVRRLKCNVFLLSYRGYGDSEGFPSQKGLTLDAQAALDHLLQRPDLDPTRIVVFGRSLGGAVGSALVKSNPGKAAGLILENTFTSVLELAAVMFPVLRFVVGGKRGLLNWFVKSPWKTIELIKHVDAPILFLAGQLDEMVPPAHMRLLYEAAEQQSVGQHTFVEFPEGMHMDTWMQGGERYWRSIEIFLEKNAAGAKDILHNKLDSAKVVSS